jgi:DNA-binding HxlR family transcriptional regulator
MSTGSNQFCPVAKASEILATRCTPLILRELLADSRSFNDIHRGIPLISRAVLVARLRELEEQGVVERRGRANGAGSDYRLTRRRGVRAGHRRTPSLGLAHAPRLPGDPAGCLAAFC